MKKRRFLYLFCTVALMLLLGTAYAWSIFAGPLETAYGWSRMDTSLAFTILIIANPVGSVLAGLLSRRIGYKGTALTASALIGLGLILTAFTKSIRVLYLTYGVMSGVGTGMLYNTVVTTIPRWFPEKQGLITGTLLMGYALSTSILAPVCRQLLDTKGPRFAFLVMGIVNTLVFLTVSFLSIRLPSEKELSELAQKEAVKTTGKTEDRTLSQMLRSGRFYAFFAATSAVLAIGLCYLNHIVLALEDEFTLINLTPALVVSTMSLFNGVGRLVGGRMIDKIGIPATLKITSILALCATALTFVAFRVHASILVVLSAWAALSAYGFMCASIPAFTRKVYGDQYFSLNYSVMNLVTMVASFAPSLMAISRNRHEGYFTGFAVLAAVSALTIPLMVFAGRAEASRKAPAKK